MEAAQKYPAAVLTISDAGSRGERADRSGDLIVERLNASGFLILRRSLVPDDRAQIAAALADWSTECALILTTGGTGFAPRDVTPEATAEVIERPAPGLAEYLRWAGYRHNARAALSRGLAGIRGRALIVNLPGSPRAVREYLDALIPLLPHALALIAEEPVDH